MDLVDGQTRKLDIRYPDFFFNMLQLATCYENLERLYEVEVLLLEISASTATNDFVKSPRWIQAQNQIDHGRQKHGMKRVTLMSESDESAPMG